MPRLRRHRHQSFQGCKKKCWTTSVSRMSPKSSSPTATPKLSFSGTKKPAPKSLLSPTMTSTTPNDSTGVSYILQQSVMCGSRKYPVKKPFDQLVNGSFSTSLKATTMADRTYFAGSCTSSKELYNLVDVPLDAVFFPKCVVDIRIFQEQGRHYELNDPPGDLYYKGVVYNHMKGFYSAPLPENILKMTVRAAVFPDNTYGVEGGGDPKVIPQLKFEGFKEFHRKYYHPSNARIWFYRYDDPTERLSILSETIATVRFQTPADNAPCSAATLDYSPPSPPT